MSKRHQYIVAVDIGSYAGCIGGEHYYACLVGYDAQGVYQRIRMEHPLTAREAKYLNKKNETRFSRYAPGDMSQSYETREQIERQAIETFKDFFPNAIILLEGDFAILSPQRCLVGPDDFKDVANTAFETQEKLEYFEHGYWHVVDRELLERVQSIYLRFRESYLTFVENESK